MSDVNFVNDRTSSGSMVGDEKTDLSSTRPICIICFDVLDITSNWLSGEGHTCDSCVFKGMFADPCAIEDDSLVRDRMTLSEVKDEVDFLREHETPASHITWMISSCMTY